VPLLTLSIPNLGRLPFASRPALSANELQFIRESLWLIWTVATFAKSHTALAFGISTHNGQVPLISFDLSHWFSPMVTIYIVPLVVSSI
jgi:hypothetical protein